MSSATGSLNKKIKQNLDCNESYSACNCELCAAGSQTKKTYYRLVVHGAAATSLERADLPPVSNVSVGTLSSTAHELRIMFAVSSATEQAHMSPD